MTTKMQASQTGDSSPGRSDGLRWAALGAFLGLGAPAGLAVLLAIAAPESSQTLRWVYVYTAVATSSAFACFGYVTGRLMARLRAASLHDGLTDLHNRRFLLEALPLLFAQSLRSKDSLALLMLDLDRFKRVNDEFGHSVGDQTIRAVALAIRQAVRDEDLVARFGGEEFVVACPHTGMETALAIAERIRKAVEELGERQLGFPGPQTISIGVWASSDGEGVLAEQALARADAALYSAKAAGRNLVKQAA